MKNLIKTVMAVSMLVLAGCGGGGGSQDSSFGSGLAKEYSGSTSQAVLSTDNSIKFIRAVNYLENLDLSDLSNDDADMFVGVDIDDHIDRQSGLGYRTVMYHDYRYKSYASITGTSRVDINSVKISGAVATISMSTDFDLLIRTPHTLLTYKMSADVTVQIDGGEEHISDMHITKYYLYDKNANEEIALTNISAQNRTGRLYVGSEGHIDFSNSSGHYVLEGAENTLVELDFAPEKAIYETQYRDPADPEEVPEPYEEKVYEPKEGQGTIENSLNGDSQSDLYFAQYQVSKFEPPKFYESQLLEYAFGAWHTHYRLLNQNTDYMQIKIEWLVNGEKVDTPIMQELPFGYYGEDDTVEVMVTVSNGDMDFVDIQKADSNNYGVSSGEYQHPEDTFEIEYRTNSLEFDLDLLAHEYFQDIDIEKSTFSWTTFDTGGCNGSCSYGIKEDTRYQKIPRLSALNYGGLYEPLYLKIYTKTGLKVARFNLILSKGSSGLAGVNREDIIDSIEEANTTDSHGYIATHKVEHGDLDLNGLEDIVYTSEENQGIFLNVSYQNANREFTNEKIAIGGEMYLGDFDGNGVKEVLMAGSTDHGSEIVYLGQGNIYITKEIPLSEDINIQKVVDLNNDGVDDLLVIDEAEGKLYAYENIDDLSKKRDIGISECTEILDVSDINADGLKDIVCSPSYRSERSSDQGTDYFDVVLAMRYLIQNPDGTFVSKTKEYVLLKEGSIEESVRVKLHAATYLGDGRVSISIADGNGEHFLYTFLLGEESIALLNKVALNGTYIDKFFTPADINGDGKKDLLSMTAGAQYLSAILQLEENAFDSNYLFSLDTYSQLTDRFIENAFIEDIDHDGSLEIVTVNGENKFSFINLKQHKNIGRKNKKIS